ncbi:DUF6455 family protein [Neorhizobium sp. Rsf11]|uniref:DUF6455 family protein n=2 Tax=Neorhizobium TaxID=1525371 RepID=A0ABV0M0V0_9HYPH|nr:DUF6455 family protein [Neorhizobium petrolearium]MCC2609322.1 DUF6455 family protein [Neorhizobium petrolearium]WGI69540.1 DUF6455 family protein [Neorhizobium petrolearium]
MNNQASTTHENFVSRIARWCSTTWDSIEEAKVLASLDDETVKILAHDNAMSRDEFISLIRRGPHAADEMASLMRLLNIDPEEVKLAEPLEFRDMHITCSKCQEKARCRRELADGAAVADFADYCANAELLNEMRARPELLAD